MVLNIDIMKIKETNNTNDIIEIYQLLINYFDYNELFNSNELIYFIDNYHIIFKGEKYLCYKIEYNNKIVGALLGVNLNEILFIDYLVIDKNYRTLTNDIINELSILLNNNKPIIIEASNPILCRFYNILGFTKFNEVYKYPKFNINLYSGDINFNVIDSNLLYLSNKKINYKYILNIIYLKHYYRWYSIYGDNNSKQYFNFIKTLL